MNKIFYNEYSEGKLRLEAGNLKKEIDMELANSRGAEYMADLVKEISAESGIKAVSDALKDFLPANFKI